MTGDETVEALRAPWPWLVLAVIQTAGAVVCMAAGEWWLATSLFIGAVFSLALWHGGRQLARIRQAIAAEEARIEKARIVQELGQ